MTRIATIPQQRITADAIQRNQERLVATQAQLASGKKANDLSALGSDAVQTLTTHSLLARARAQSTVAKQLGTTLSLYDTAISGVDTLGTTLQQTLLTATGTGETAGLQNSIESAFSQFSALMNTDEGGVPLFGGGQSGAPFAPATLKDLAADPGTDFSNGTVHASARVGDNLDMVYGVTASDLGGKLAKVFRALADAGPFTGPLTSAQHDALQAAGTALDGALTGVRAINAQNGQRQAQAATLATRADDRATLFEGMISTNEDADLGQIAMDLSQQKTMLQASYSVFSQLSSLSLVSYLR
ncbi:flagellin [Sphingomonas sp. TREG-RG-20F-R18-01]|uniref:flagellin n=1 Tax=Sphingomonas sp. TREG-RG-20F-R18-01 TaxID=2914982 RepID=UPI001F58308F|nr:flagellin [Sphingomonas sp. TREG-RG-20F-R18-01]